MAVGRTVNEEEEEEEDDDDDDSTPRYIEILQSIACITAN
jgi:hypothetical protein